MMDALVGTAAAPGLGLAGKVGIQWPSDIVCGAPTFETSFARVAVNGGAGAAGMFGAVTVDIERSALSELGVDAADEALVEELATAVLTVWTPGRLLPIRRRAPQVRWPPCWASTSTWCRCWVAKLRRWSPSGLPLAVGVFAGLDIWGRATIKTDAGEQEFPPEAVRIRGL